MFTGKCVPWALSQKHMPWRQDIYLYTLKFCDSAHVMRLLYRRPTQSITHPSSAYFVPTIGRQVFMLVICIQFHACLPVNEFILAIQFIQCIHPVPTSLGNCIAALTLCSMDNHFGIILWICHSCSYVLRVL